MFSAIRTIFRTWGIATRSRAADNVDIEAQVATASYSVDVIQLPIPSSSCLHQPRVQPTPLEEEGTDPIEDFFGIIPLHESPQTGTQDSRHDDFMTVFYHDDVPPPPYTDASDLPSYDAVVDPPSLAMYLFKFGFCE